MHAYDVCHFVQVSPWCVLMLYSCMSNFKRGRYTLMSLLSLLGFGSFIIWDNLAGLFWQRTIGYSAVQVMLRFVPQSIASLLTISQSFQD